MQTLLVPLHAPWSKVSEVVDFVIAVRAPRAFEIHDGLLNETGLKVAESHVARAGPEIRHRVHPPCPAGISGGLIGYAFQTPVSKPADDFLIRLGVQALP